MNGSGDKNTAEEIRAQARRVAPVVWLLGKVQSGKSSIVRATGTTRAEIGSGFKACTMTAAVFDFPSDAPLIRFLDTRGLGEAGYDPDEDLAVASASTHATIAVMRAMDPAQDAVVSVLVDIRRRFPDWPVVVAQSHLHEGYEPGEGHAVPYPYRLHGSSHDPATKSAAETENRIPEDLRRALTYQRELVRQKVPGKGPLIFVPIDLTLEGDGYQPLLYGLEPLQLALADAAPAALQAALDDATGGGRENEKSRRLHTLIVGHATAASAADLIPVAAVAAVPAVQARLLQLIAGNYDVDWNRRAMAEFAGALGAGFLARYAAGFGIRQLAKLIPVYGQTAGAAAAAATSFATTYALGKAAIYYLAAKERGRVDTGGVKRAWADALREAFDLAHLRGLDQPPAAKP